MIKFIRRERLYVLMLFFILAINVAGHSRLEKKTQEEEKKPVSTMTFEEMGVTEEKVKGFLESDEIGARFFRYAIVLAFFILILSLFLNLSFIFGKTRITTPYRTDYYIKMFGTGQANKLPNYHELNIRANLSSVPWGILDLLRVSIIIIFAGYIIAIIESMAFKFSHINIAVNLRMIVNTFFIDIAVGVVLLYFVIVKHKEKLHTLGLRFSSFFKNVLSGIKAYITILPILFIVLLFSVWLLTLLGYSPPPQPLLEVFMEEKRSKVLLFLTAFVSVFGPIIEEMFFRGFMYTAIRKRFGIFSAAFLSASIFSILHTNIVGFLPIMILGLLLAYLYERTGSLVASMAVHIVHNSIIVVLVFFVRALME